MLARGEEKTVQYHVCARMAREGGGEGHLDLSPKEGQQPEGGESEGRGKRQAPLSSLSGK